MGALLQGLGSAGSPTGVAGLRAPRGGSFGPAWPATAGVEEGREGLLAGCLETAAAGAAEIC